METTLPDLSQSFEAVGDDADAPCTAELAECSCPDFCERDHANE